MEGLPVSSLYVFTKIIHRPKWVNYLKLFVATELISDGFRYQFCECENNSNSPTTNDMFTKRSKLGFKSFVNFLNKFVLLFVTIRRKQCFYLNSFLTRIEIEIKFPRKKNYRYKYNYFDLNDLKI